MDTVLTALGLSEKEARIYLLLLENRPLPAVEIARLAKESRTNTYMLLDGLLEKRVVELEEGQTVRRFIAAPPQALRQLLVDQEQALKSAAVSLRGILPQLAAKYQLAQHKPGVTYTEGLEGLRQVLDDMVRTKEEVLLIPSAEADMHHDAYKMLQLATAKRQANDISTRVLLPADGRTWPIYKSWQRQGVQARVLEYETTIGEVILYSNVCVFIEYSPEFILTTTLTNAAIATTMRQLFEQLWKTGKP